MTPEQKLIQIVEGACGDDLYRARVAFGGMSDAELDEHYGQSGQTRRQILQEHERHHALYQDARALLYRLLGAR
jgi:hypothetical protein